MASQCNNLSENDAADALKYHTALLHAERRIATLEWLLVVMVKDTEDYVRKIQCERELASSRYSELLHLRRELAKWSLDELK